MRAVAIAAAVCLAASAAWADSVEEIAKRENLPVSTHDGARALGITDYVTPEGQIVRDPAPAPPEVVVPPVTIPRDASERKKDAAPQERNIQPAERRVVPAPAAAATDRPPRAEPIPAPAAAGTPPGAGDRVAPNAPVPPSGDAGAGGTGTGTGAPPASAQAPRVGSGAASRISSKLAGMKGALGGLADGAGGPGGASPNAMMGGPGGPAAGAPKVVVSGPSGDPSAPRTREDLLASVSSGYGSTMRDMGLRTGRGPDGRTAIVDAAGKPASDAALSTLAGRIAQEPRALMKRPDYYDVIPRGRYQDVQGAYAVSGGARPEFKDIGMKERDFAWKRSCDRVSGDCNPLAAEKSYKQNEDVSPETLANVWKKLKDGEAGDDDGWAEYVKEQRKSYEESREREERAMGMRERLSRGIFGAGGRLAGMLRKLTKWGGGGSAGADGGSAAAAGAGYAAYGAAADETIREQGLRSGGEGRSGERAAEDGLPPEGAGAPWNRIYFALLGASIIGLGLKLYRRKEEARRVSLAPLPPGGDDEERRT